MSDMQHVIKFQLSSGSGPFRGSVNPTETFERVCSAFDGTSKGAKRFKSIFHSEQSLECRIPLNEDYLANYKGRFVKMDWSYLCF